MLAATPKVKKLQRNSSMPILLTRSLNRLASPKKKQMTKTSKSFNGSSSTKWTCASKIKSKPSTKNKSKKTKKKTTTFKQEKPNKQMKNIKVQKIFCEKNEMRSDPNTSNYSCSTIKPLNEYFVYGNTYIPIQNSAQRRFAYKLNLAGLPNYSQPNAMLQGGMNTEQGVMHQIGCNTQTAVSQAKSVQTHSFNEKIEKCFSDTLADLQFLFLPENRHFQAFEQHERAHYSELFSVLAAKMKTAKEQEMLTAENIQMLLFQREAIQLGAVDYCFQEGFPTTVKSSLCYIANLFSFILTTCLLEIVERINTVFGKSAIQKLRIISSKSAYVVENEIVLDKSIFMLLEAELFKDHQFANETVERSVHVYNLALFDCVNERLRTYLPYFCSDGELYPWQSLRATYFIDEEAMEHVFEEVKESIQKSLVVLCGSFVDFSENIAYHAHPFYQKKNDAQITKITAMQVIEMDFSLDIEHHLTASKIHIADQICEQLLREIAEELSFLSSCFDFL